MSHESALHVQPSAFGEDLLDKGCKQDDFNTQGEVSQKEHNRRVSSIELRTPKGDALAVGVGGSREVELAIDSGTCEMRCREPAQRIGVRCRHWRDEDQQTVVVDEQGIRRGAMSATSTEEEEEEATCSTCTRWSGSRSCVVAVCVSCGAGSKRVGQQLCQAGVNSTTRRTTRNLVRPTDAEGQRGAGERRRAERCEWSRTRRGSATTEGEFRQPTCPR